MSAEQILSAAAALREFSVEEVAAFCDETPSAVALTLRQAGPRFVRAPSAGHHEERWRVASPRVPSANPPASVPSWPARPHSRVSVQTRLLLAQDTLLECIREEDPYERRLLSGTAANHIRQALAEILDDALPWWAVDASSPAVVTALRDLEDPVEAALLRITVALERLIERAAAGARITAHDLRIALVSAGDLALPESADAQAVVDRLWDLSEAVLASECREGVNAVSRFKAALSKRRTRARASESASGSMRSLMALVEGLTSLVAEGDPWALYQLLDRLPDGRDRVVVYCDLLSILPSSLDWQEANEVLPGTMVEALVERAASTHLDRSADALERHLRNSPFRSEAALLGQTAHVLAELAEADPFLDASARARVDRARTDILHLAMSA